VHVLEVTRRTVLDDDLGVELDPQHGYVRSSRYLQVKIILVQCSLLVATIMIALGLWAGVSSVLQVALPSGDLRIGERHG
jgi:hypothetical protein